MRLNSNIYKLSKNFSLWNENYYHLYVGFEKWSFRWNKTDGKVLNATGIAEWKKPIKHGMSSFTRKPTQNTAISLSLSLPYARHDTKRERPLSSCICMFVLYYKYPSLSNLFLSLFDLWFNLVTTETSLRKHRRPSCLDWFCSWQELFPYYYYTRYTLNWTL